ncbi:MAG: hypothetical protein ACRDH5_16840 [bacterium]
MGSLSGYQPSAGAGAVHGVGGHVVWCPESRKKVLAGPVAGRLWELLGEKSRR